VNLIRGNLNAPCRLQMRGVPVDNGSVWLKGSRCSFFNFQLGYMFCYLLIYNEVINSTDVLHFQAKAGIIKE
jgi:hypothetical protein